MLAGTSPLGLFRRSFPGRCPGAPVGDWAETLHHAEEVQRLAAEQGLSFSSAGGAILRGWALASGAASDRRSEPGQGEDSLAQIRAGLAAWSTSAPTALIQFLTMLADVCGKVGKVDEGLAVLAEALQRGQDKGAQALLQEGSGAERG